MYFNIISLVGLTLAYQTMDKDEISQSTHKLRQDEAKKKTHNANSDTNSASKTETSRTCSITSQFMRVSLQKTRKRNLPEVDYNSSPKMVRNEQGDVYFNWDKKWKRTDDARRPHPKTEAGNKTGETQLLKKDKDGDTYVLCFSTCTSDLDTHREARRFPKL